MRRFALATALVVAVGLGASMASAEVDGNTVNACINNSTNVVRIKPTPGCSDGETPVAWSITGPAGIQGPQGPAGSPDTPNQVLAKISQVDGDGSGLDASLLDGINSTSFLRTTGKAADANLLDGVDSSAYAKRATNGTGTIGLSSIGANRCADVVFNVGAVQPGDTFLLNVKSGDSLPAGLTMNPLDIPTAGKVNVRICNGTNTASAADGSIGVRWYVFR